MATKTLLLSSEALRTFTLKSFEDYQESLHVEEVFSLVLSTSRLTVVSRGHVK